MKMEINIDAGVPAKDDEVLPLREWVEEIEIRPGLKLSLLNFNSDSEVVVRFKVEQLKIVFGFLLTGEADCMHHQRQKQTMNTKASGGYCGISYLPEIEGLTRYSAGLSVAALHIGLEPELLGDMVSETDDGLPLELRYALEGKKDSTFWRTGIMTSAMQLAVNQILCCPCHGPMRRMYLESKAIELMALQLGHYTPHKKRPAKPGILNSQDIERLHAARELILTNRQNPPSLNQLARDVGLNEFKLKKGFRRLFGNTVFGCLHDHRMGEARRMLEEGELSVKEVAWIIGYRDSHSFSDAFMKYFGIRPSRYGH